MSSSLSRYYDIYSCEGRSIVQLIKAGSSAWIHQTFPTSETSLGSKAMARLASVSRRFSQAATRTSSDANLSRRVFSHPQETRRTFRRKIPLDLAVPITPYPNGTVRFGARSPRHFVPGYDHAVPPGHFATSSLQELVVEATEW